MNKKQLENRIKMLNSELSEARNQIDIIDSKTVVKCEDNNHGKGCEKGTQIKNLQYIQTHWYVRPSGCSDGDYHNPGDGNWVCPKCGHRNRMYGHPEIVKLKRLFKSVFNEYEHDEY